MSRIVYNKLVRDAVPEEIRRSGGDPVVSILPDAERRHHLCLKVLEEAYETFRSGADADGFVEEAADLLEVLRALASELSVDWDTIEKRRMSRQLELGGFSQGIFLECVRTGTDNLELEDKLPSTPCLLTRGTVPFFELRSQPRIQRRRCTHHLRYRARRVRATLVARVGRDYAGFLGSVPPTLGTGPSRAAIGDIPDCR